MLYITNAIKTDTELIGEGDKILLKDNWGYTYSGVITYIDVDVMEIRNTCNLTKAFEINSIEKIIKLKK